MTLPNRIATPSPSQLEQDWLSWLQSGRDLARSGHWEGACIIYKRAFAIAEKLLCQQGCAATGCQQCALKRYLATAEEFAYVIRKNDFDCALDALLGWIENQLETQTDSAQVQELMAGLSRLQQPQELSFEALFGRPLAQPG